MSDKEFRFGPAALGSIDKAIETLEKYHKFGFRACELSFGYGVYIKKKEDALRIGAKAKEYDINLSIHAPYYINLNSSEPKKIRASKDRIIECCRIGNILGAKTVVFHPGFYGDNKQDALKNIIREIREIQEIIKKEKLDIEIAPETMGKINVFGSVEEVSEIVKETECSFCIDFAHVLARDKKIDYDKIERLFNSKKWHVHFSGIVYGEKGEKHHITTKNSEWTELLSNIPKNKEITIINESPTHIEDSLEGLKIYKKLFKK